MDVTFLENEPFYPASAVQGEQISNEPQNLELFFEPQILEPSDSQIHPSSNHFPSFDHVYSRRRPLQLTDLQNTVHNQISHNSSSQTGLKENGKGTIDTTSLTIDENETDDRPSIKKGNQILHPTPYKQLCIF